MKKDQLTTSPFPAIPESTDTGSIGIMHLKRYWARLLAIRNKALPPETWSDEWVIDNFLLNTLGLGIEQTLRFVYETEPSFAVFEEWVLVINNGYIQADKIETFNATISGSAAGLPIMDESTDVLSPDDLDHWQKQGYVIVRNAISPEDCQNTVNIICKFLQVDIKVADTWYPDHSGIEGIMVQLFQHPQLNSNRLSPRIRKAYEQLWRRKDILVNNDKAGFNPPQRNGIRHPVSRLHWDVSLQLPIPFGTQGILYLTDTAADGGALTVVPGFHNKVANWIHQLPPGTNPRLQDLEQFGVMAVAANAGDLVIWHQALPHAAGVNRANTPRLVQYINYAPAIIEVQPVWI